MKNRDNATPRHESVDHEAPTAAGMLNDDDHVPGTGIMGDETLVHTIPGGLHLPDTAPPHTGAAHPRPGPTPPDAIEHAEPHD